MPAGERVLPQLFRLLAAIWRSRSRRRLVLLAAGIVATILANAGAQVGLNLWQGAFYDALERRDVAAFVRQLLVFAAVAGTLLTLVVAQTWLQEVTKVGLRAWLTRDLLDRWLAPRRPYLLAFAGPVGTNPDQRLHEDARHLAELSVDLGGGLLQAVLLLASFVGVLWVLSEQVVFRSGTGGFVVPGYMVWCALAYSCGGSWLTWRVGRPLIRVNTERYAREAELRAALVRIQAAAEAIALYGGEQDERRAIDGTVSAVVAVTRRLAGGTARLTWVTSGYGWLALVVPILVAAPGYFGDGLGFGWLMMVVGAFTQVLQALRWFVDNFPRIADWRATLWRVATVREALLGLEALEDRAGRIEVTEAADGVLRLENLSVDLPDGRAALDAALVEVRPAERVLIVGDPGSGKSTLFRAMAGLWPWGGGTVRLPREGVMFMPQRPYLPPGTLRAAVAYPAAPDRTDDAAVQGALERVGLGHLVPLLDREERWDRELGLEDQQRLAFARVLLHAPRWVIHDAAVAALDEEGRRRVFSIFRYELANTAVVGFRRSIPKDGFYARALRVVRLPAAPGLRPSPQPRPARPGAALAGSAPMTDPA